MWGSTSYGIFSLSRKSTTCRGGMAALLNDCPSNITPVEPPVRRFLARVRTAVGRAVDTEFASRTLRGLPRRARRATRRTGLPGSRSQPARPRGKRIGDQAVALSNLQRRTGDSVLVTQLQS